MARQVIDTTTNNGSYIGDPAKTAFGKVNAMTDEIYTSLAGKLAIGQGGWYGANNLPVVTDLFNMNNRTLEAGMYTPVNGANAPGAQSSFGLALAIKSSNLEWRHVLQFTTDGDVYDMSITNPSQGGTWRIAKFYTTLNTTRAADGTLKAI
ncbi:hypothetical protein [Pseudomonas luteola]|uniref:hypothetical protein n=1 Tax=Pseudomonas luteola TaxID=47886 RepID=UPI001239EBE9|nr:hypothetical protein [Pseudomonas luteola]QEU28928.1 hypothetical protein FOB45_14540 [Pseudomonas luteola]